MKRLRCVKIVATLGPASSSPEKIRLLHRLGADVFRINMSHTAHPDLTRMVSDIRALEESTGRPIAILADLQGPKLRLGTFAGGGAELAPGSTFVLDDRPEPGDAGRVHLPHPELLAALHHGHRLLIDDGKLELRVESGAGDRVVTTVVTGGHVADRKGISLPDSDIPLPALTEKDRRDLDAALHNEVDWIALSFIQRPDDIAEARKLARGRAGILAKLEKPKAIERLEAIVEYADALMVARGDLGVEMPLEQVPVIQKRVIAAARRAGKPVIIATQMLESMTASPVPTRAEVSDVANAVFEGADAIMLSAESASGAHPAEAVAMMDRIATTVEGDAGYRTALVAQRATPEPTGADAIAAAARQIAETLRLSAIVCYTTSGATALRVARERPFAPLVALSPSREVARRLQLVWGVHSVVSLDAEDEQDMVERAARAAVAEGLAKPGDRLIAIAGVPFGTRGATNFLRLAFVGGDGVRPT